MNLNRLLLVSSVFLLAACGGGGTGTAGVPVVSAAPTPTPSSSTPTPTPMVSGPSLLAFTGSQQFNTLDSILQYDRSATGALRAFVSYDVENTLSVIYDTGTSAYYYFFNGGNIPPHNRYPDFISVRFGAAARDGTFSTARGSDSGATYTLRTLTPGSNATLSLTYASIGAAEGALVSGGSTTTDYRVFGYGFPDEQASVPTTGRATYTGIVIGRAASASGNHVYTVTGTINFATDFTASTFTGSVTLNGTDDRTGEPVSFGSFPIATSLSYANPLNTINNATIGTVGNSFRAFLAGPAAEELVGSFVLSVPDPLASGVTLRLAAAAGARR